MSWRTVRDPSSAEIGEARRYRKAKLYADEDVEDYVVEMLRAIGVNIKSARELPGHCGKDDEFHAAYAKKKRRFLLTP